MYGATRDVCMLLFSSGILSIRSLYSSYLCSWVSVAIIIIMEEYARLLVIIIIIIVIIIIMEE